MNHTAIISPAFGSYVEETAERADIGNDVVAFNIDGGSIAMCDTAEVAHKLIVRLAQGGIIASIVKR